MKAVLVLSSLALAGCASCIIPTGTYSSIGGSENQITLELQNTRYVLKHEQWQPGQYDNRSTTKTPGIWSCSGQTANFELEGNAITALYEPIGENPLGMDTKSKALIFKKNKTRLSDTLLYQKKKNVSQY